MIRLFLGVRELSLLENIQIGWLSQPPVSGYHWLFHRGQICRVMKLTTYFHLFQRLRMRGATSLFPIRLHGRHRK
jgi:hypothetical protein